MSESQSETLRYLTPPEDAFWRWSPDGKTVEWSDGTTIAFAPELIAVLERLAPHGLPPFDLVLLVLAACRDSWGQASQFGQLFRSFTIRARGGAVEWIQNSVTSLERVQRLSAGLRNDIDTKAELAALIFEYHPIRPMSAPAERVCRELRFGVPVAVLTQFDRPIKTVGQWIRELRGLCDGLQRVDEETLRLRLKTGLDRVVRPAPPEPEEPEEPPTPTICELLDALEQEEQFRGLVRLTRNLMAVVHLPKPVADRDELSLGGVSDITNRGPLDRLLLSELAHDTDTLTIRVALNEALYLRRERPPSNPPRQRVLLLDSGLRMWGVPRVYAAAVALSMAATAGKRAEIRAFRAAGAGVVPIDLATRDGLIAHLAALDPEAQPGESLEAFREELVESDSDVVLITGEDVLADPEFRRALAESGLTPLYLAVLGRDGRFQLVARTERGQKLVREAELTLDELLESNPDRPMPKIFDPSIDPRLPAILRLRELPLRLPCPVHPDSMFLVFPHDDNESLVGCVSRDRRLLLWDEDGCGPRQICDTLPPGRLKWCSCQGQRSTLVVGSRDFGNLYVVHVRPLTYQTRIHKLTSAQRGGRAVCEHAGALFVIRECEVEVFDPESGDRRYALRLHDDVRWVRDRYFRASDGWYALSFDGVSARLEQLVSDKQLRGAHVVGMFDTAHRGPVAVLRDGTIYFTSDGSRTPVSHGLSLPVRISAASRSGRRFVISPPTASGKHCLVQLLGDRVEVQKSRIDPEQLVEPALGRLIQRACHRRIARVFIHQKSLVVELKAGRQMMLAVDGVTRRGVLRWLPWTLQPATDQPQRLQQIPAPSRVGYSLRSAEWPDGSRAVVDSRGLLHLQSSDVGIPEFTLVLCDDDVAGWCADGRVWGSEYFLGKDPRPTPADEIMNSVIAPFVSRLE